MILARGHTTIRRPHRSIDNLCGVRTQEQGYLGDFVDVAYGLLTYVRIWRGTVSSVKTAGKNQTRIATSGLTGLPHASDALHVAALRCERGGDVGSHRTRCDGIATDPFGTVKRAGVLRQANETMLARGIRSTCERHISTDVLSVGTWSTRRTGRRRTAVESSKTSSRGNVDNYSLPPHLQPFLNGTPTNNRRSRQIQSDDLVPHRSFQLSNRIEAVNTPGRVDHKINPTKHLLALGKHLFNPVVFGDVRLQHQRALWVRRGHFLPEVRHQPLVDVAYHHVCSGSQKGFCDCSTETTTATGYESRFLDEVLLVHGG
jgi:hypothetical protein